MERVVGPFQELRLNLALAEVPAVNKRIVLLPMNEAPWRSPDDLLSATRRSRPRCIGETPRTRPFGAKRRRLGILEARAFFFRLGTGDRASSPPRLIRACAGTRL